jgi:hypothetical protein
MVRHSKHCSVEESPLLIKPLKYWVWWSTPVIPALGRLRLEDWEFQASLGYIYSYRLMNGWRKGGRDG